MVVGELLPERYKVNGTCQLNYVLAILCEAPSKVLFIILPLQRQWNSAVFEA